MLNRARPTAATALPLLALLWGCELRANTPTADEISTVDQLESSRASPGDVEPVLISSPKEPLRAFRLFPAPFYTPETSIGAAMVTAFYFRFADHPDARTSSNTSLLGATLNKQFSLTDRGDFFFGDNAYYLFYLAQARLWPDSYYGIGNDTLKEHRERFENQSIYLTARFQKQFLTSWYFGPYLETRYYHPTALEKNGQLVTGTIPGAETNLLGAVGLALSWDTRSSSTFPLSGIFHEFWTGWNQDLRGGPYNAMRADLDLKKYASLSDDHVFAFRLRAATTFGPPGNQPFTAMSPLGGEKRLRGIVEPRYRDRSSIFSIAEYRLQVSRRWGAAAFAGLGQAASDLLSLRIGGFHPTAGAGIRYAIIPEERVNLRLDVATSDSGQIETYISAGEAF